MFPIRKRFEERPDTERHQSARVYYLEFIVESYLQNAEEPAKPGIIYLYVKLNFNRAMVELELARR